MLEGFHVARARGVLPGAVEVVAEQVDDGARRTVIAAAAAAAVAHADERRVDLYPHSCCL